MRYRCNDAAWAADTLERYVELAPEDCRLYREPIFARRAAASATSIHRIRALLPLLVGSLVIYVFVRIGYVLRFRRRGLALRPYS